MAATAAPATTAAPAAPAAATTAGAATVAATAAGARDTTRLEPWVCFFLVIHYYWADYVY
jgi:hypothetical protein